jgi:REP-associated tyrosine transposase
VQRNWHPHHGPIPAKSRFRRNLFFHGHTPRPSVFAAGGPHRFVAFGLSGSAPGTPFDIDAIVILPEHLHAIMTLPANDADFSGRWHRIKGHFTTHAVRAGLAVERDHRGEYPVWQKRFWEHTIRDEADLARHVDYIHFNPIKHGLAVRVRDWPFSSFHQFVRRGLLPKDWAGTVTASGRGYGEREDSEPGKRSEPGIAARNLSPGSLLGRIRISAIDQTLADAS